MNEMRMAPTGRRIKDWSAAYGAEIGGIRGFAVRNRWRIAPFDRILAAIGDSGGGAMLDIGGAEGLFLFMAARAGFLQTGMCVEADRGLIDAGQKALRAQRIQTIEFLHAESVQSWPGAQFDIVTMLDVLHHVPRAMQREFILAACDRVLPGGLFVYKDMSDSPFWMALANRVHDLALARQWISYAPVEDVADWVASRRFALERAEDIDRYWYAHELRVFRKASS